MGNCIFCSIVEGKIPCEKVYENSEVLAFKDINPEAPVHVLIIPKRHISSVNNLQSNDAVLLENIFAASKDIAQQLGVKESGYRLITNCGDNAGQSVEHLHFHLLGGRKLTWPPG